MEAIRLTSRAWAVCLLSATLLTTPVRGVDAGTPARQLFDFLPFQDNNNKPVQNWDGTRTLTGDVNGDGRADLIWNLLGTNNDVWVGLARADGTFDFRPRQQHGLTQWAGYAVETGDFNGDGRIDLEWNNTDTFNRVYVALGESNGAFSFLKYQDLAASGWSKNDRLLTTEDVNGDGKGDLTWLRVESPSQIQVALSKGDGTFALQSPQPTPAKVSLFSTRCLAEDVNGDKIGDLAWNDSFEGENNVRVSLGQKSGVFRFLDPQKVTLTAPGSGATTLAEDVNGDGRGDLVWAKRNLGDGTNSVFVALGRQDGRFDFLPRQVLAGWENRSQTRVMAADVNGDGRGDLVWTEVSGPRVYVALGQATGTFDLLPPQDRPTSSPASGFPALAADVNGDGLSDLVANWINANANRIEVALANCSTPQTPRRLQSFDLESRFSTVDRGPGDSIVYTARAGGVGVALRLCGQHYHCKVENDQGCGGEKAAGPAECGRPEVGNWVEIHTVYAAEVGTACDRESLDCCAAGPFLVRAYQAKVRSGSPDEPLPDPWDRPLFQWSGSTTGPDEKEKPNQCKPAAQWSFSPGCDLQVSKEALEKRFHHPHGARGLQSEDRLSHDLTKVVPP